MTLAYNDIRPKTMIVLDGQPHEVLSSNVFRKQQRKPVNQTKLKNLNTGKVIEHSFHQSETVEEAAIETKTAVFIFSKNDVWWFHESGDKAKRFSMPQAVLGSATHFLKEGAEVEVLLFNNNILGVRLPIKMHFTVIETPPNVKGNTAQGGTKPAVLESGATVTVPMFIEMGDVIEINTETETYVQRVSK